MYCCPSELSPKIPYNTPVFVIEMNNSTNKIEGIGLIKKIEYDDLFGCVMITLNNGKMFDKEDKLKLVKSK